ncbi:hypothetical protein [Stutzerimonas xanthomarina]|uniref:hypothetical protein n=1 Tax=Stutzerimonas xanthomarina TaxID=271420 RepID=UPI003AA85C95
MSDILSVLSLFTAFIAAGFAMRAAEQAQRANELNLVEGKIRIYEAVNSVHMHHLVYASRMDQNKVNELIPKLIADLEEDLRKQTQDSWRPS